MSTQIVAVLIVGFGLLVGPIPWSLIGLIWAYCIVWVFIEDWAKVHLYRRLEMSGNRHRRFIERIHERPRFLAL